MQSQSLSSKCILWHFHKHSCQLKVLEQGFCAITVNNSFLAVGGKLEEEKIVKRVSVAIFKKRIIKFR
ncbi:hypothetical protein M5689_004547 [Euphorbia peplus]|nr:hypothetical protein M5689_004547 [Euphorbia peplus]